MPGALANALLYSTIPAASMIAGGLVAAFRAPGPRLRSAIQHFAAGVVFAAAAGELLPDIVRRHRPMEVVLGFGIGVASMLAIRGFSQWRRRRSKRGPDSPLSLVIVTGVDVAIDGMLIGLGFVLGGSAGPLLTLALTTELLFLGLSVAAELSGAGASPVRVLVISAGLAALVPATAAAGAAGLQDASVELVEMVLAFGLAALLYLVTEELLVEAHEVPETPVATAVFFLGFLALLVLEMLRSGGGRS